MQTALMRVAASGRNYDCKIVDLVKAHSRFVFFFLFMNEGVL